MHIGAQRQKDWDMPSDNNIAFFNQFALSLFEKLYASFPMPVDIDADNLAMGDVDPDAASAQTWTALDVAYEAVEFLAQEGFLTHKGARLTSGHFVQVRLTLKGLAILGYTPDSLDQKATLISRIRSALSGGAKEAGAETMRQLVQQAFTAALASGPALLALGR